LDAKTCKHTLSLKDFILPFEIINILLVGCIFPSHELYIISCLLQYLSTARLKPRAILQFY
jgi:hypothetical protein